jgi:outer membrane protein assembly factor BamE (lipoprotein component of BamABCDE complex)
VSRSLGNFRGARAAPATSLTSPAGDFSHSFKNKNKTSAVNSLLASALRTSALAASLFLLPAMASANNSTTADRAQQLLSTSGTLPVKAAGPYVEAGTFRIQVSAKLGRPTFRFPDGTWLYENFSAADGSPTGTLIVRFNAKGQVSDLSLASPAAVMALRTQPTKSDDRVLVATANRR